MSSTKPFPSIFTPLLLRRIIICRKVVHVKIVRGQTINKGKERLEPLLLGGLAIGRFPRLSQKRKLFLRKLQKSAVLVQDSMSNFKSREKGLLHPIRRVEKTPRNSL